jgi:hypothetical protein
MVDIVSILSVINTELIFEQEDLIRNEIYILERK